MKKPSCLIIGEGIHRTADALSAADFSVIEFKTVFADTERRIGTAHQAELYRQLYGGYTYTIIDECSCFYLKAPIEELTYFGSRGKWWEGRSAKHSSGPLVSNRKREKNRAKRKQRSK